MRLLWLSSLIGTMFLLCYGQAPDSSRRASQGEVHPAIQGQTAAASTTGAQPAVFVATADRIKRARPGLTQGVLDCDTRIVQASLPEVKLKFGKNGFNEAEAMDAALQGWEAVRLESPLQDNKCMVQPSFQRYVTSLGKMVFRTSPDEAMIEVDGRSLDKHTRYSKWYEPKSYAVRYTKAGFEPFETQCTIANGKETDCFVALKSTP